MRRAWIALFLLVGATTVLADSKLQKEEKQDLPKIAAGWVELGRWCVSKNLTPQARRCAERATEADASSADAQALAASISSGEATPDEKDVKEYSKKLLATGKKIGPLYDKLVAAAAGETDAATIARVDGWFVAALEADPEPKRWERAVNLVGSVDDPKDHSRAQRLAESVLALKPPEKVAAALRGTIDAGAIQGVVLKGVTTHNMRYWFNLPPGYARRAGKKWPVLVALDGSGSFFEEGAKGWRDNRGKADFIIVSPCTFANSGHGDGDSKARYRKWYTDAVIEEGNHKRLEFDETGVIAIMKDLERDYDAEPRFYLHGFSAGGALTYTFIWKHPDLLNAATPVCTGGGRGGGGEENANKTPAEKDFPIWIVTGEKDPGPISSSEAMVETLNKAGYPNVKHTTIPGMAHSNAMVQVAAFFKPYMDGSKKRTDKQ
jgi:poly(3-hydroxybutyrate) depolymerase